MDTYSRLPERSWSADGRRTNGELMTPEVFEEVVHNDKSAKVKVHVYDSSFPDEDPRKVKKAETEPLFHD